MARFTNFELVAQRPSLRKPLLDGGVVGIAIVCGAIFFPDRVAWIFLIFGWFVWTALLILSYLLVRPPLVLNSKSNELSETDILELSKLKKIAWLSFGGATISPAGFQALTKLHHVDTLDLSETNLTDEHSGCLASIRRVHALILDQTQITDRTLEKLAGKLSLCGISLEGTKVTEAGEIMLSKSIPGLRFGSDYWN